MMSGQWFESWLPLMVLVLCALTARRWFATWLHPAAFVLAVWSASIGLPLVFGSDFPVSPAGVWCMVALALAVAMGAALAAPQGGYEAPGIITGGLRIRGVSIRRGRLRFLVLCALACGLLYCVQMVRMFSPTATLSVQAEAIAEVAHEASVDRYSDSPTGYDATTQLLSSMVYLAPALAGILFSVRRTKTDAILCWLAFTPTLLSSLLSGTRGGIGWSVALATAFYLTSRVALAEKPARRRRARRLLLSVGAVLGMLVLSTAVDELRVSRAPSVGSSTENLLSPRTRATFFGHVAVFTIWFDGNWKRLDAPAYGAYTLAGPLNWFGLRTRARGLFSEPVELLSDGTSSNIYTVFRAVIEDYSMSGATVALWLVGVFAGCCYRGLHAGRQRRGPVLAVYYASCLFIPSSLFVYNSLILALILAAIGWRLAVGVPARFGGPPMAPTPAT